MIFDLDDTLVHSGAVREAFAIAATAYGIRPRALLRTLVALPGRPALEIFEALGLARARAIKATERFLAELEELNAQAPPVPYPDAPDPSWTSRAVTVGDSPQDMRLGAEHRVPIRIGVDRSGDPRALFAAGATHVVNALAEIVPIVASSRCGFDHRVSRQTRLRPSYERRFE